MKLKNYLFEGFGFPVIFKELPAIKLRGEIIPDIDFSLIAPALIKFICMQQAEPLSGYQVRFFRSALGLTIRDFAKLVGVRHPSVIRWEKHKNHSAQIEAHIEIVIRILMIKKFDGDKEEILEVMKHVEGVEKLKTCRYKKFQPVEVPSDLTFVR